MTQMELETTGTNRFQTELARTLSPLRKSLGRFLSELGSPKTPTALQKQLGGAYAICWQIYRLVHATEATAEAQHAPSPGGLKRLMEAAEKKGVSSETIDAVQTAADRFREFIKSNADDRASFDSMVTGVAGDESAESVMMRHRQLSYRSLSHVWGIQIDTNVRIQFTRMSISSEGTDECMLSLRFGVRRLRPDAPLQVLRYQRHTEVNALNCQVEMPLDPEAATEYGAPILPRFCSQPLPPIATHASPSGWTDCNFVGKDVGLRGSADIAFGMRASGHTPAIEPDGGRVEIKSTMIRTPVRLYISDFLIHRPSIGRVNPEVRIYHAMSENVSLAGLAEMPRLPINERVQFLGSASEVGETPDIPNYSDMLHYACGKTGWDLAEFDVYRVRIPYPIMHSLIAFQFPLPAKAQGAKGNTTTTGNE